MKVMFDFAAGRLSIEGDGSELLKVLEVARDLSPQISQIQIITSTIERERDESPTAQHTHRTNSVTRREQGTLRQFARSLTLSNSAERIAAIAYYVNRVEGKQAFSPKEIDGWFTMCGFQKPSQMAVALFDAKRKYGYLDNIGRAMWRISTQGENLIIGKMEENSQ